VIRFLILALLVSCSYDAGSVTVDEVALTVPAYNSLALVKRIVTVDVQITDTTQSATSVVVEMLTPKGKRLSAEAGPPVLVSGNTYTWTAGVVIPAHTGAGAYTVSRIAIRDNASTLMNVYRSDLLSDIPNCPDCAITSEADLDAVFTDNAATAGPQLGGFSVIPDVVNGTTGESVTCSMDNTGVDSTPYAAKCEFTDPNGKIYACVGRTSCSFDVEPNAQLGFWLLNQVVLVDEQQNKKVYDRAAVASTGATTYLDVNSTGSSGGTGGAPAGYDYCNQAPSKTLDGSASDAYFDSTAQEPGTDTVLFNGCIRADAGGAVYGIGETATDALTAFNAAIQMYDSGSEKYFRAQGDTGWVEPRVKLNWVPNSWYKIRIYADIGLGTYYAEVADCAGGDDYYWISSDIDMVGTPTSLNYYKIFAPTGTIALLHTPDWYASTCAFTDCFGGTLSVDVSALPPECTTATWDVTPRTSTGSGPWSGTTNWGPTPVNDAEYLIQWSETEIQCSHTIASTQLDTLTGKKFVFDDDQVFDLADDNYVALDTAAVQVTHCIGQNCLASPPPVAAWSVTSDAPFAGVYSASGNGNGPLPQPLYAGRNYTIHCAPETNYTAPDYTFTPNANYTSGAFCVWTYTGP